MGPVPPGLFAVIRAIKLDVLEYPEKSSERSAIPDSPGPVELTTVLVLTGGDDEAGGVVEVIAGGVVATGGVDATGAVAVEVVAGVEVVVLSAGLSEEVVAAGSVVLV